MIDLLIALQFHFSVEVLAEEKDDAKTAASLLMSNDACSGDTGRLVPAFLVSACHDVLANELVWFGYVRVLHRIVIAGMVGNGIAMNDWALPHVLVVLSKLISFWKVRGFPLLSLAFFVFQYRLV